MHKIMNIGIPIASATNIIGNLLYNHFIKENIANAVTVPSLYLIMLELYYLPSINMRKCAQVQGMIQMYNRTWSHN